MCVTFDLTLDDLVAFQLYCAKTSPTMKQWFWRGLLRTSFIILLSIPISLLFFPSIFPHFEPHGIWLFIPIFFLLGWIAAWPRTHRSILAKSARRFLSKAHPKGDIGRHMVAISAEGVTETTETNETRHLWSGIEKVEQDEHYLFWLYGPLSAYLIPKSAFADVSQANQFFAAAQTYRAQFQPLTK